MALRALSTPARRRITAITAIILVAGLAATMVARSVSERMVAGEMQRRFTADAADLNSAIGERLRMHAEILVSMQGLYASIGRVDRAQFRRYIEVLDLGRRYPGLQALQSLRHVTPAGLDAFVAEVRGDTSVAPAGQPDFEVRPAGQRPAYNVVEFVEPMRGNEKSLGFDAGANPAQLDSLRRAAETGHIVATPPVNLVQDTTGGLGFIIRVPIYRTGEPTQTTTQRNAALLGFVAAVYRMNDLMRGVLDARSLQQMQIQVIDRGYAKANAEGVITNEPELPSDVKTLMYDSQEPNVSLVAPVLTSALGIDAERSLVVGERAWRLLFTARAGSIYQTSNLVPNLVLASGVVISVLLAMLAIITLRSRRLSGDFSALNAEQRALVDNPLAGILFTRGRSILRGNRRIAELCDLAVDDLPSSNVDALLASEADSDAFAAALSRFADSGVATEVELQLRRKDGTTLLIDAYGRPLAGRHGKCDILWVIQDKTDALLVEAERRDHARELQSANARLTTSLQAAEVRAKEIALLSELSGVLQSCQSKAEILAAIQTYAGFLFPSEGGALYLLNETRDSVSRGAGWGSVIADADSFPTDDCWALRRGSTFPISEASEGLVCSHAAGCCTEAGPGFICQPLIAQSNLLGLLYRERPRESAGADQLGTMLAEQVSLAIANLELREQLRGQAIRDPLTDLYNRRYLEDALTREIARSARDGQPLALAILDIDHFKRINDSHGHAVGDAVLRGIGRLLRDIVRDTDIAGRLGGEEFLLLLPGATLDVAQQRAGELLEAVRRLQVMRPGGTVDGITASIGLAVAPLHGIRGEALLSAADTALYRAKGEGRDRAVVFGFPVVSPGMIPDAAAGSDLEFAGD